VLRILSLLLLLLLPASSLCTCFSSVCLVRCWFACHNHRRHVRLSLSLGLGFRPSGAVPVGVGGVVSCCWARRIRIRTCTALTSSSPAVWHRVGGWRRCANRRSHHGRVDRDDDGDREGPSPRKKKQKRGARAEEGVEARTASSAKDSTSASVSASAGGLSSTTTTTDAARRRRREQVSVGSCSDADLERFIGAWPE
jgi:hypothetical protein